MSALKERIKEIEDSVISDSKVIEPARSTFTAKAIDLIRDITRLTKEEYFYSQLTSGEFEVEISAFHVTTDLVTDELKVEIDVRHWPVSKPTEKRWNVVISTKVSAELANAPDFRKACIQESGRRALEEIDLDIRGHQSELESLKKQRTMVVDETLALLRECE